MNLRALREVWRWPERLIIGALIGAIWVYQRTLSPLQGNVCRFEPSCSRYMVECLRKYGLFRGLGKGVRRVCRCHPFDPGGYDPP
jgi:putative membrane protein insertion efficiency factor